MVSPTTQIGDIDFDKFGQIFRQTGHFHLIEERG